MHKYIETCDRCGTQSDDLPGELNLRAYQHQAFYDLCKHCIEDLREWFKTQPNDES